MIEFRIKEEERPSPELGEPMYIDLTLEGDEAVEVEGGELITNESELEPADSSWSASPSEDEWTGIKEKQRPSSNHYSKWKRLVVSKFLCGKLWVRFPTKIKATKHITHKTWTTTKDIYGIPDRKSLL